MMYRDPDPGNPSASIETQQKTNLCENHVLSFEQIGSAMTKTLTLQGW